MTLRAARSENRQAPSRVTPSHPAGTARTNAHHLPAVPLVTVALLVVGQALTPRGLDRPITTTATALHELPIAAAHSSQLYLSNLLVVFGLAALGVTFSIIGRLISGPGSTPAMWAAVVGGVGALCGALGNLTVGFNLAAAATAHTTTAAAAQVLTSGGTSVASYVLFVSYLGGVSLATILTGMALWRSRTGPRWLAPVFLVGLPVAAAAPPGGLAIPLSLPLMLAMLVLAIRVRQFVRS